MPGFGKSGLALTTGLVVLGGLVAGAAHAQSGSVVYGTVRSAESGLAMPYSVVSIPALGREEFTNDRGGFTLLDLPAGPFKFRFRHIGFAPRDTSVVLRAGDTLRVEINLTRLAIKLDAMHVTAACEASQDAAASAELTALFEQVRQNADQFRLLVRSHPFTRRMTAAEITRMADGKYTLGTPEVSTLTSDAAAARYKPGRVFHPGEGRERRQMVVDLPELPDFADSVFIAKHCFSYGGDTTVDSVKLVRIAFSPVRDLTDPDLKGVVLLRVDGYAIWGMDLRTSGVPRSVAPEISGVRVVTQFQDILPGIGMIKTIESFLEPGPNRARSEPKVVSRGEIKMLVEINWTKGPP